MTIKSDLNLIFPIPVWTSLMPNSKELNQKLLKYIKSLQASDPKGKYKSSGYGNLKEHSISVAGVLVTGNVFSSQIYNDFF